jgi:hypothetical protein
MNIHNRLVRHSPQGDGGRTTQKSAFAGRDAENHSREAAQNTTMANLQKVAASRAEPVRLAFK